MDNEMGIGLLYTAMYKEAKKRYKELGYVPDRNVASFQNPIITPNVENYLPPDNDFVQPSSAPTEYDSLDQLPVLD